MCTFKSSTWEVEVGSSGLHSSRTAGATERPVSKRLICGLGTVTHWIADSRNLMHENVLTPFDYAMSH